MIGPLAWLLTKNGMIAAGSVATVTLTGAGGYLTGTGQAAAPQIQVNVPPPVTRIQRVTVVKPVRTIIIRHPRGPQPRPGPQAPPAPPPPGPPVRRGPPPAPRPAPTVTVTPAPQPSACDQPPGWCKHHHTPRPRHRHP